MYNNYEDQGINVFQGKNQCRLLDLFEIGIPFLGKMQNTMVEEAVHLVNTVLKD
jgi:hypothetical protein